MIPTNHQNLLIEKNVLKKINTLVSSNSIPQTIDRYFIDKLDHFSHKELNFIFANTNLDHLDKNDNNLLMRVLSNQSIKKHLNNSNYQYLLKNTANLKQINKTHQHNALMLVILSNTILNKESFDFLLKSTNLSHCDHLNQSVLYLALFDKYPLTTNQVNYLIEKCPLDAVNKFFRNNVIALAIKDKPALARQIILFMEKNNFYFDDHYYSQLEPTLSNQKDFINKTIVDNLAKKIKISIPSPIKKNKNKL